MHQNRSKRYRAATEQVDRKKTYNLTDAVSALINLGYRRAEAFAAVATASRNNPAAKIDDLIRASLAELSRKDSAA